MKAAMVYKALKARIISGDLPAGSVIDEVQTAAEVEVSRTPVRDALARLTAEGLLEPGARRQAVVVDLTARQHEITVIRSALEVSAVQDICRKATVEQLDQLRLHVMRQQRAMNVDDSDEFLSLDEDFHRSLVAIANLPLLAQFLDQLGAFIKIISINDASSVEKFQRTIDIHIAIIDAIEARDESKLRGLIEEHINQAL